MNKTVFGLLFALAFLVGCGGGSTTKPSGDTTTKPSPAQPTTKNNNGKTTGKYSLWEYITPKSNITNSFIETKDGVDSRYNTTYSVSSDSVTEVSDYAKGEKTIYTKKSDRITVLFLKDEKPNGSYDLDLTANVGDFVTIKESSCKLANYYANKKIGTITFTDVIEISCNNNPGYYQKGVGEIAQVEELSTNGSRNSRILSN